LVLLLTCCLETDSNQQLLDTLCVKYEVPAAAFFVIENNKTHFYVYGQNNQSKPTDKNTVFEAASLSKVVFYQILKQEFSQKGLSTDSSLYSFGLTMNDLERLATRYNNAPFLETLNPLCLNASVSELSKHISGIDGGEVGVFNYSESGYLLLQLLLEKITSLNLQQLYLKHFGFKDMSFTWEKSFKKNTVDGFVNKGTEERKIRKHKSGFSNGTLTTSIEGLSEFCAYYFSCQSTGSGASINAFPTLFWNEGIATERMENGNTYLWHYGSNYCFNSFILINPKEKKAYGILANSVSAKQMMQELFSKATGESHFVSFDFINWY
jgi:CubicO group peptidase (beta-lactamase class C family)